MSGEILVGYISQCSQIKDLLDFGAQAQEWRSDQIRESRGLAEDVKEGRDLPAPCLLCLVS